MAITKETKPKELKLEWHSDGTLIGIYLVTITEFKEDGVVISKVVDQMSTLTWQEMKQYFTQEQLDYLIGELTASE